MKLSERRSAEIYATRYFVDCLVDTIIFSKYG